MFNVNNKKKHQNDFNDVILVFLLLTFNIFIPLASVYIVDYEKVSGAQLERGGGEGGRPPLPFFENQKQCPDLRKKCSDCVHP